jgi:hypothetical protein
MLIFVGIKLALLTRGVAPAGCALSACTCPGNHSKQQLSYETSRADSRRQFINELFERIAVSVHNALNQAAGRVRVFPRYGHFFELNLPHTPRLIHLPPYL